MITDEKRKKVKENSNHHRIVALTYFSEKQNFFNLAE